MAVANPIDLDGIVLRHGSHKSFAQGACVMELRYRADGRVARGNTIEARLFGRVVVTDAGCWEFTGGRDEHGYGVLRGRKDMTRAHRLAWELIKGPIPEGMFVCHRCDNPPCCNPGHLFLGTATDNNRDRQTKGRSRNLFPSGATHPARLRRGERHWCARLSDADVQAIRAARKAGEMCTTIAARFGVNAATISRISRGVWR